MIKVITDYPIATDSPDYLHPWGTVRDNTICPEFWESIQKIRKDHLSYLDLGCAGGGLVIEAHRVHGYDSIGLEGSDYWVQHMNESAEDAKKRVTDLQLKYLVDSANQWKKYHGTRLFTCDISRPFSIFDGLNLKQFDLITAWEVLEHIQEDRLHILFDNVNRHLSNGIFLGTVSIAHDAPQGVELHQTIRTSDWWEKLFCEHFKMNPWPQSLHPARFDHDSALFLLRKKNGM